MKEASSVPSQYIPHYTVEVYNLRSAGCFLFSGVHQISSRWSHLNLVGHASKSEAGLSCEILRPWFNEKYGLNLEYLLNRSFKS